MAMIPPGSQEGWYYSHWFAEPKKEPEPLERSLFPGFAFLVASIATFARLLVGGPIG